MEGLPGHWRDPGDGMVRPMEEVKGDPPSTKPGDGVPFMTADGEGPGMEGGEARGYAPGDMA